MAEQDYETKPKMVKAIQWTGDNLEEIQEWTGTRFLGVNSYPAPRFDYGNLWGLADDQMALVDNGNFMFWVSEGDWIVCEDGNWLAYTNADFNNKFRVPEVD